MSEKPLQAVRKKPKSSLVVGLALQRDGRSDAFISAGNTGAMLAGSTMLLGLHDGVERATVATLFPTGGEPVLVLDGGANLDCSPRELLGFAYLGTVYMRDLMGRPNPGRRPAQRRRGGGEGHRHRARGAPAAQAGAPASTTPATSRAATSSPGPQQRIPVDVVVCDGFVGNVVLKFYESSARVFVGLLKERIPDVFEPARDGRPQPHSRLLHLRRRAAARRARASRSSATAPPAPTRSRTRSASRCRRRRPG